jgi:hypothetical protein
MGKIAEVLVDTDRKVMANVAARAASLPIPYPGQSVYDLSSQMQMTVGQHVIGLLNARDRGDFLNNLRNKPTDAECYLIALNNFGLVCPHPRVGPRGGDCDVCGTRIVR